MKKLISLLLVLVLALSLTACGPQGGTTESTKGESAGVEKLVADYGYQWTDPTPPS